MIFSIYKWHNYRLAVKNLGFEFDKLRAKNSGRLNMQDQDTIDNMDAITGILEECSNYMTKCGIKIPPTPWKYDSKDETTHISNKEKFAYGHLLHLL